MKVVIRELSTHEEQTLIKSIRPGSFSLNLDLVCVILFWTLGPWWGKTIIASMGYIESVRFAA